MTFDVLTLLYEAASHRNEHVYIIITHDDWILCQLDVTLRLKNIINFTKDGQIMAETFNIFIVICNARIIKYHKL